jgi:hypothetical protein
MKENDRTRHATSDALIALRQAMKMTQAQFAVLVLDCAITTVGRYETTHPPQGDLLLRLGKIAKQEANKQERSAAERQIFIDLGDRFSELYVQDVHDRLGWDLMMIPKTEAEREHAHVLTRVNGERAIKLANYFIWVARALDAKDENEIPNEALEASAAMQKAAESIMGNQPVKFASGFSEIMANPAKKNPPAPKTTRKRSKKL